MDDLSLAKLRKIKKRGGEWASDIFMHVEAVSSEAGDEGFVDEPQSAPFFPYLLMIVDNQSGLVLVGEISPRLDAYTEDFTKTILKAAHANGKPSRILVCNERTQALFSKLAKQLGAELIMQNHIPLLEEARDGFFERFDDDSINADDQIEEIMNVLADPEMIKALPDAILIQISEAIEHGMLPADVSNHVRKECQRRKL